MNRYIENLKGYLKDRNPDYGFSDANSLLEMLYYTYGQSNPLDNARIRIQFKELDAILSKLSLQENDAVFSLTSSLCLDCQKQAFLDGIQVGMRLFTELNELPG